MESSSIGFIHEPPFKSSLENHGSTGAFCEQSIYNLSTRPSRYRPKALQAQGKLRHFVCSWLTKKHALSRAELQHSKPKMYRQERFHIPRNSRIKCGYI
eukprot:429835-Pelagomonas_calceolata.AAC.8